MNEAYTITGIKNIVITATTQYPVVSAYEYEFLKGETVVRERTKGCSIYFILQRPLMYFNNVRMGDGNIVFDIIDTVHAPLRCKMNLVECGLARHDEPVMIEVQFYKTAPDLVEPYNDVAAFKIVREDGTFVVWETPQKLLYEAIANDLPVKFDGEINDYLKYHVHYIGKAFSQPVWDRLTGHEKMQRILTLEGPIASKNARAPFEIGLLMLDIVGVDEANIIGGYDIAVPPGVTPILHTMESDDEIETFYSLRLQPPASELTSEVEGILVSTFKPAYNEKLFDSYPNISKGTRSAGYTHASLIIEKMPVVLETDHHTQELVGGAIELVEQ
jgi:hypothetical protein